MTSAKPVRFAGSCPWAAVVVGASLMGCEPTNNQLLQATADEAPDATADEAPDADELSDAATHALLPFCAEIEAEAGALVAPMEPLSDATASGGTYVATSLSHEGEVTFTFTVDEAADYYLTALVLTAGVADSQNSFFVGADGDVLAAARDPSKVFHTFDLTTGWQWDVVDYLAPPPESPQRFALAAGSHTVTFYGREFLTALDKVALHQCPETGCAGMVAGGCTP